MADWTYPGMRGRLAMPPIEGEEAGNRVYAYASRRILEVLGKESRPLATSEITAPILGNQMSRKLGLHSAYIASCLDRMVAYGILRKEERDEPHYHGSKKMLQFTYYSIIGD